MPRQSTWNGGVIVKSSESKVTHAAHEGASATYADREKSPQRPADAEHEEKRSAEKPKTSEEIVIEEISIDGMCGVY